MLEKIAKKVIQLLRRRRWKSTPVEKIFTEIYRKRLWKNNETVSGPGSAVEHSKQLIYFLPRLLSDFNIHSIVDLACGDFNWLKEISLDNQQYLGLDIVHELIEKNKVKYGSENRQFQQLNIIEQALPKGDLVICRDVLVHLNFNQISSVLSSLKSSNSNYLMATTFPFEKNEDIVTGTWRPINLQQKPFNLPAPLLMINENPFLEDHTLPQRFIALWKLT